MKRNFYIFWLFQCLVTGWHCWATDTAGVKIDLIEMTPAQAIELNLEMEPMRVGRKETGEPIFQQLLTADFHKKLAKLPDVIVTPVPQLNVQLARRGEIKMGTELRFPKSRNPSNGRIDIDSAFLGYEIVVVPFAGKGDVAVDLAMKVTLRELNKEGELLENTIKLPEFHESGMESRMIVTSGKTVCFGEFTKLDGRRVMIVGKVFR